MTNTQIKGYLEKYRIKDREALAQHIIELKRNTAPNVGLISELVYVLEDKENLFFNFFPQNVKGNSTRHKSQNGETHKQIVGDLESINRPLTFSTLNAQMERVKGCPKGGLQCFCDGSCNDKKSLDLTKFKELSLNRTTSDWVKSFTGEIKDDVITSKSRVEKEIIEHLQGIKESQAVKKAPIFTYCKVNRNAIEALSLRALYGHEKYEKGDDWENFSRVPNGDFEYSNSLFRHALGIGEEDEETHLVASAWNAIARLEIYLRNKLNKS